MTPCLKIREVGALTAPLVRPIYLLRFFPTTTPP